MTEINPGRRPMMAAWTCHECETEGADLEDAGGAPIKCYFCGAEAWVTCRFPP